MIHHVELLVHWEDYSDITWEDEATTQRTAGKSVCKFWESVPDGRDGALGLTGNQCYVPLRVSNHRRRQQQRKNKTNKQPEAVVEYLVEWVGYRERTWEPAGHLDGAYRDILEEYLAV